MKKGVFVIFLTIFIYKLVMCSTEEESDANITVVPTDRRHIIMAFEYALECNDITTIYWLLRKIPIFKYGKNESLKNYLSDVFLNAWSYRPDFAGKFKRYLKRESMFEELAILLIYACVRRNVSSIKEFLLDSSTFLNKAGKNVSFLETILQSRNLSLLEVYKAFLQTFVEKDMCLTQKLTNSIGAATQFDQTTFLTHIFTSELHIKYQKFLVMLVQTAKISISNFSEETMDSADVEVDVDSIPPKVKCYEMSK